MAEISPTPERLESPLLMDAIRIRGARQHNLQNVSLDLPRNKLIVITGVSGSGKSSLAFDTIFAEGQRRYVESLSAYARQFLEQMEKPDLDSIEGLSPAISIEQRTTSRNPRSTVGTVTEIYDYLRLLYASIGQPHCPKCGRPIQAQTVQEMVDRALRLPPGTKFMVLAPYVSGKKGEYKKQMAEMVKEGFLRARVDGKFVDLDDPPELDKQKKHTIEIVVDRLVSKPGEDEEYRKRLADSIETATRVSGGLIVLSVADGPEEILSANYACPDCGTSLTEVTPRLFSFNSPYGACPACSGLGTNLKADPERLVAGSVAVDRGRRHRDPEARLDQLALAADGDAREALQVPPRPALRQAVEGRAERHPLWLGRRRDQVLLRGREGRVPLALVLRGARPHDRAPLPGEREPRAPGGARGVHVGGAVPGVPRPAPEARGARGAGRRAPHRRGGLGDHLRRDRVFRGPGADARASGRSPARS